MTARRAEKEVSEDAEKRRLDGRRDGRPGRERSSGERRTWWQIREADGIAEVGGTMTRAGEPARENGGRELSRRRRGVACRGGVVRERKTEMGVRCWDGREIVAAKVRGKEAGEGFQFSCGVCVCVVWCVLVGCGWQFSSVQFG